MLREKELTTLIKCVEVSPRTSHVAIFFHTKKIFFWPFFKGKLMARSPNFPKSSSKLDQSRSTPISVNTYSGPQN